ncbi:MAG: hypothetical protein ACPG19_07160 [Saprospiraceae bacterium]
MKYKFFLSVFLLCFAIKSNAQIVPGYQGKRTYIEYNLHFVPTLLGVNTKGSKFGVGERKSLSTWSFRHKINMNYVTKRNAEMGGSISLGNTGVLDKNSSFGTIRFTTIGFNYNRYFVRSTGALAPLGRYFKLETQYIQTANYFINHPRIDHHFAYLGAGIGSRKVFKDFFTLNLSFQSGLILPLGTSEQANTYKNDVRLRLQYHYLYEVNIGVGFLLF